MTPSGIILIKIGYGILFMLALTALIRSIIVSAMLKDLKTDYNILLKYTLIAIIYLSIIQSYQCIDMMVGKIEKSWWIPFFCKHGALWFYHIAISFIKYKALNPNDCNSPSYGESSCLTRNCFSF